MATEKDLTWEFLHSVNETLDSYRVRALIDAKKDIMSSDNYDEEQYYQILFQMIDVERMKYSLFNYLNTEENHNFKSLKQFTKENSIDIKKTLSFLELLKNEGLIEIQYPLNDANEEASNQKIEDQLIKTLKRKPSELKSIYEPVGVIFDSNNCSGCGLCAGICPVNCVNVYNGFGKIEEEKCTKIIEFLMQKKQQFGTLPPDKETIITSAGNNILLSRNETEQLLKRIEEIDTYIQL